MDGDELGTNMGEIVDPVDNYDMLPIASDAPHPRNPQGFHK